ncbi:hypothetical protein HY218_00915 [Candidatus Saccharibacteria bacterium]|nr:hypothetical protein [Candidatus Saccharibacteria bacterium]
MATIHFVYVGAYMVQIVVYDAWKLITPQAVMRRWIMGSLVLSVNTVVWYLVHSKPLDTTAYKLLAWALIVADIALASFNVYEQRGMASRAVALYAIPLIVSTVLLSRSALLATAVLSIVAYATTAVSYFVLNFNEGYKIELYGEVGSYCILFVIMAALLWVTVRHRQHP